MPGQSPPAPPRGHLPRSAAPPPRGGGRDRDRSLRPDRLRPAPARAFPVLPVFLAVLSSFAFPGFAGPAPGDSASAPPVSRRPARWVPDAPAPGGLLWIDRYRGPAAGAENLLLAHGALSRLENRVLPTRLFEEENRFARLLSLSYRLGKFLYLDLPVAAYLPVVQHELSGHGWRAREAGYEDIRYEVPAPPPYGPGGGETRFYYPEGHAPGHDDILAMAMAGIEAEDILARTQRDRFLRAGSMDYPGALLYLGASLELAGYVAATDSVGPGTFNDVSNWLVAVNRKAGRDRETGYWITRSDLASRSLLALADPFLWYAAWAVGKYLWDGTMRWRQPMVPLGPARWLPSLGYRLSPFGGQFLAENLLALGPRVAVLRAAWGDGELGASWGADLEARDLARWRGWSLDAALRAWSQPPLRPEDPDPRPAEAPRLGAGLSAAAVSPALFKGFPLRLAAGVSAKRAGYVPGESLESDLALRAGVGLYR